MELSARIPIALTVPREVVPAAEDTATDCPTFTDLMLSSPIDRDSVTPLSPTIPMDSLVVAWSPVLNGTALIVPEMGAVRVALSSSTSAFVRSS